MEPYFSTQRHPHYPVIFPSVHSGMAIRGWMVYEPPRGCLTSPRPSQMSGLGWLSVLVAVLVFWPAACLPCCCTCSYDGYQVPVFEDHV